MTGWALAVLASLCVCTTELRAQSTADTQFQANLDRMARIDSFAWAGPTFLRQDSTVEKVRALDRITREQTQTELSPIDRKPIRYTTLKFENGLEMQFRTFDTPTKLQVLKVALSSAKWPVSEGLGVGAPVARVVRLLGAGKQTPDSWLQYSGETEHVDFLIKDGLISSVVFTYSSD